MTVNFINDCSWYHAGSALVAKCIRKKINEHGMSEAGRGSDLYLVNGEGSLHWDFPQARKIRRLASGRPKSSRLAIINSLWSHMSLNFGDVDILTVRESLSANEAMKSRVSPDIRVIPDISLCHTHQPSYAGGDNYLVVDSVVPSVSEWLEDLAGRINAPFIRLCEHGDADVFIDRMASCNGVITGRFHGMMLAILAGAPFIAAPSNSWKTKGFLRDIGHEDKLCDSLASALRALDGGMATLNRDAFLFDVNARWNAVFAELSGLQSKSEQSLKMSGVAMAGGAVGAGRIVQSSANYQMGISSLVGKKIIIVGNGPSINGSCLGKIIDAHDEVVRFNLFQLNNLEDTGSKTTIWSTFGRGTPIPADGVPDKIIMVHERSNAPQCNDVIRIPAEFHNKMTQELRAVSKHKHAESIRPSSGFLVVRWLLENGIKNINLAGFDHFSKQRSKQHHYWDQRAFGRPTEHDGDAESDILRQFREDGKIFYLT
jgi:hypothetical protein